MEIKEEYDGFIGIYDNAFDQGYIKELIKILTSKVSFFVKDNDW